MKLISQIAFLFIIFSCCENRTKKDKVENLNSIKDKLEKQNETCKYLEYGFDISDALTEKHSNNSERANELFKSAFSKVNTPFGKDLVEAMETAIKTKDENQTKFIVEKLLTGGIPIEYFNQYLSILKTNWWKKIEIEYPEIKKKYEKEYDLELLKKLISLRTQDSLFNVEYHQFRKGEKHFELEYLVKMANKIYNGFKELVNNYGFPSEINCGYFYKEGKIQQLPTKVILIHIHQLGEPIIKKEFTFEEIVCKGHLQEFDYDYLNSIMRSIGGGKGIQYEMEIFYEEYKNKN